MGRGSTQELGQVHGNSVDSNVTVLRAPAHVVDQGDQAATTSTLPTVEMRVYCAGVAGGLTHYDSLRAALSLSRRADVRTIGQATYAQWRKVPAFKRQLAIARRLGTSGVEAARTFARETMPVLAWQAWRDATDSDVAPRDRAAARGQVMALAGVKEQGDGGGTSIETMNVLISHTPQEMHRLFWGIGAES